MDIIAFARIGALESYVRRHYGDVPRFRGARLMRLEETYDSDGGTQDETFNRHCGKDVVYVHTRCGGCGDEEDEDSNYRYFEADEWERSNSGTFIESVDDEFDFTYRDHYFRAVKDDEYERLLADYWEGGLDVMRAL